VSPYQSDDGAALENDDVPTWSWPANVPGGGGDKGKSKAQDD
jgi:hypothetical protein